MSKDLLQKAARGVGWNVFGQGVQQAIRFIVIIILTRVLDPRDFGIFAMVLVFTEFILPFRERGFQAALIQRENIDEEYQSVAFWSVCGAGAVLYGLSVLLAPWVGRFFNTPLVAQIIPVIAIVFLLGPFGAVQWALYSKTLNFRVNTLVDITTTLGYGIAVCGLAFHGFGVWSFVWALVVRELLYSLILWFSCHWRPLFKFDCRKFRELWKFSVSCMGSGVLNYGINNFDNLMVGKFLGAVPLGFYNLAFNTISHPQTKIISQIVSVIFPVYSMIKDDKERLGAAYLKTVRMALIVIVPLVSILFVAAHDFVLVFYGQKWLPAVLPIRIMCFYGLLRALVSITSPVFLSKGMPDVDLKLNVLRFALFALAICYGIRYGIVGVATGVLVYSLLNFLPSFYLSNRLLGIPHAMFVRVISRYLALSLVPIGTAWMAGIFLQGYSVGPLSRLVLVVSSGLSAYAGVFIIFLRPDFDELVMLVKKVAP